MSDHNDAVYKAELLDLMRRIDAVFTANGIDYFAIDGTCLGAVREAGIIQWDDDIDIGVMRVDFSRALKALNESNLDIYAHGVRDYKIECVPRWGRVFNRVNTQSSLERRRAYVDLDVFDYAPSSNIMFRLQSILGVGLRRIIERRENHKALGVSVAYIASDIIAFPFRILTARKIAQIAYRLWTCNAASKFVKRTYDGNRKRYLAESFASTIRLPFSGQEISVPIGYEEYLAVCYGDDWRIPPPPDKRISHAFTGSNGSWAVPLPDDEERSL